MISFSCPSCNAPINIDDSAAGQQGECIQCKSLIVVPNRTSTETRRDASGTGSPPKTATDSTSNSWYVSKNGNEFGPFSDDQLMKLATKGQITRETMVRMGTQSAWSLAQNVEGLFAEPPKLRMARPQPAASAMPIAPTAAVVVPTAVPYSPAISSARLPNQPAKKSGNRLLLASGSVVIVCIMGGAAWFLSGRGEQASNSTVSVGANNAVASMSTGNNPVASGTTRRTNSQPTNTKVGGKWYFEGNPGSWLWSQPSVVTLSGTTGSWRVVSDGSHKTLTDITALSGVSFSMRVDGLKMQATYSAYGSSPFLSVWAGKQKLHLMPYDDIKHSDSSIHQDIMRRSFGNKAPTWSLIPDKDLVTKIERMMLSADEVSVPLLCLHWCALTGEAIDPLEVPKRVRV